MAFVAANRRNYFQYRDELGGLAGVRVFAYDEGEVNNYQYVVLEVDEALAGVGRDALLDALLAENVVARRYFYPGCHRMEPYRSAGRRWHLPVTERLADRVLALPTGTSLDSDDVDRVAAIVRLALTHGRELSASLDRTCP